MRQAARQWPALYSLIQEHLPSFLHQAEHVYRNGLPKYVRQECNAHTKCGIHAHGFARARCQSCGQVLLVAFSCKKRGICPSCNVRRMADTAARLVDRVLPDVRLRQWLLSITPLFRMRCSIETQLGSCARRFCDSLHEIESPRRSSRDQHVKSWSDALNIALVTAHDPGLQVSTATENAPPSQYPAQYRGAEPTSATESDDIDFRDEIPSVEWYFRDEVPPD